MFYPRDVKVAPSGGQRRDSSIEDLKRLRRGIGTEKKEGVFPSALGHPVTEKGSAETTKI